MEVDPFLEMPMLPAAKAAEVSPEEAEEILRRKRAAISESLKKRIANICGPDILFSSNQSLKLNGMIVEELQQIKASDSDEVKKAKKARNKYIQEMREAEYAKREPEIISELDKIAERIRTFDAIVTDESGKEIVDFSTHFFSGLLLIYAYHRSLVSWYK